MHVNDEVVPLDDYGILADTMDRAQNLIDVPLARKVVLDNG